MSKLKKLLKEEYNKVKKGFERLLKPRHEKHMPQPALDPYRQRRFPRC